MRRAAIDKRHYSILSRCAKLYARKLHCSLLSTMFSLSRFALSTCRSSLKIHRLAIKLFQTRWLCVNFTGLRRC